MYKDGSTIKKGTNYFRCGKCSEVFDEKFADKHENITWLGGLEHDPEDKEKKEESQEEEKEKKIDDIAKQKRAKLIQSFKDELKDMDDDELDKILESIQHDLEELRKKMNPEENEKKQSKQASVEFIGVEPQYNTVDGDYFLTDRTPRKSNYNVLTLKDSESVSGDSLLIRMGSTDDHTVGNSSGDKFLQSLGSVD